MAGHVVTLSDGTTTLTLTDRTTYFFHEYRQFNSGRIDETVEETITLGITGSDAADMADNVRAVERLLNEAQRGDGARVYLNVTLLSDGSSWRSEVFGGHMEQELSIWEFYSNLHTMWRMVFRRESTFEATSTTQATWSVGGTQLSCTNNGANYGIISNVAGSAPAKTEIQIYNSSGVTQDYKDIWIAHDATTGWTGAQHRIAVANPSWATAENHGTLYGVEDFPNVDDCKGRAFRIIGAFTGVPVGIEMIGRVVAADAGSGQETIIDSGLPVSCPSAYGGVFDFGAFILPPNGRDGATEHVSFGFTVYDDSSGSSLPLHYHFYPAEGVRRARVLSGHNIGSGALVSDNGIEGLAYIEDTIANRSPAVTVTGRPIALIPGKANRIAAIISTHADPYPDTLAFSIKVNYRPRRFTV